MPKMLPEYFPEAQRDEQGFAGEYALWSAFQEQLSNKYWVLWRVPWLAPGRGGQAHDGEVDFMVLHPDMGILLIEVKGGGIAYDAPTDQWTSRDRNDDIHAIKDPVDQVKKSKYALMEKLKTLPGWSKKWFELGHAVAFPNCKMTSSSLAPALPGDILIDGGDLGDISSKIESIFTYWTGRTDGKNALEADEIDRIVKTFSSSWELPQPLGYVLKETDQQILKLTEEQFWILNNLKQLRRVSIGGGAGTGKTVLALEMARRLAGEGFRVLLTCYNNPLAESLQYSIPPGFEYELTVRTFHKFCNDTAIEAGIQLPAEGSGDRRQKFFDEDLPAALFNALEANPYNRYDAIIVDEGQDFRESWWMSLQYSLIDPDNSILLVFHDDNQRLYEPEHCSIPTGLVSFPLSRNLRNTRTIHSLAGRYYEGQNISVLGPVGEPIEFVEASGGREICSALSKVLHRLIHDGSLSIDDIAVLTGKSVRSSCVDSAEKVGAFKLGRPVLGVLGNLEITGDRLSDGEGAVGFEKVVYFDSIKRFKGLEKPVVILIEVDDLVAENNEHDVYVGLSRARSHLVIIGNATTLKHFRQGD
ncbi:NERD domain-containing protein [Gemmatimonadota bacterium]